MLAGQLTYYSERADEYDEWYLRTGRYDRGPAFQQQWQAELAEVAQALAAFGPTGDVLELAAGTGHWTERLAQTAATLTALDGSPETLTVNARRTGGKVRYEVADLFEWQPNREYDVVFFGFWLSHVPPERFAEF